MKTPKPKRRTVTRTKSNGTRTKTVSRQRMFLGEPDTMTKTKTRTKSSKGKTKSFDKTYSNATASGSYSKTVTKRKGGTKVKDISAKRLIHRDGGVMDVSISKAKKRGVGKVETRRYYFKGVDGYQDGTSSYGMVKRKGLKKKKF